MRHTHTIFGLVFLSLVLVMSASAEPLAPFGKHQNVTPDNALPKDATFKVAFDVAVGAEPGKVNRSINSLARFINMHSAIGVPPENLNLALVVHGSAAIDLLDSKAYKARTAHDNANQPLIALLLANGVKIHLCGQSASARQVKRSAVIPGVEVTLSAMTSHALLQQAGYTLNPF